jgi:hypothetical protein
MFKLPVTLILLSFAINVHAQTLLTPEQLWKFGRVNGKGISKDGKFVVYNVSTPSVEENKSSSKTYAIPIAGGSAVQVSNADSLLPNPKISPDGKYTISSEEV